MNFTIEEQSPASPSNPSPINDFLGRYSSIGDLDTPTKSPQSRGRSLSLAIPALLTPTASRESPALSSPLSNIPSKTNSSPFRNALRHLLQTLQSRPRPPTILSQIKLGDLGNSKGSGASKGFVVLSSRPGEDDQLYEESDDEERPGASKSVVDETCDLMLRLRDALMLADQQGLQVLSSTASIGNPASPMTPVLPFGRRRRSTVTASDGRPNTSTLKDDGHLLFKQCVAVLGDVILNDCRFTSLHPRPSRPPNALQSVCLDVARCLITSQRGDPKNLHSIGMAVIPAFGTFPPQMHVRLLEFFELSILRPQLVELSRSRGRSRTSLPALPKEPSDPESSPPGISIRVEEAANDPAPNTSDQGWIPWSTSATPDASVVSTYAPDLSLRVYYLASVVSPLLASVLESVDIPKLSPEEAYWIRRLVDSIVELKPDAYLDVLEVVAYHTPRARKSALSVLTTFWPKALGHNVVGRPLSILQMKDENRRFQASADPFDQPHAHEFLPWRFPTAAQLRTSVFPSLAIQKLTLTACRACQKPIHDFGLLCPFCNSAVHFKCYDPPEGSVLTEYTSSTGVQRLAISRFSYVLPSRRPSSNQVVIAAGHALRPINIFTLSLCFVCREPIWGSARQGLMCSGCQRCAHTTCVHAARAEGVPDCSPLSPSEAMYTVDWSLLRRSFVDYYRSVLLSEEDLLRTSYESISVLYCVLWVQLQILNNGVAAGTIVINQSDPTTAPAAANRVDNFELQYWVRLFEAYLGSGRLRESDALHEFRRLEGPFTVEHSLLFEVAFLHYSTSLMKSTRNPDRSADDARTSNLLFPDATATTPQESDSHPCEIVELAHARDVIGREFQMHSDKVAQYFLQYLNCLGFIERIDLATDLFGGQEPARQSCMFPLPLAIELSTTVETLFTAVEACLNDIDIMVNEAGFQLLVRRCWPNGLASAYALDRLIGVVLRWVVQEDRKLMSVARDYVALNKPMPGIRTPLDPSPWPNAQYTKSPAISQGSAASGNDYLACRKALLESYALPWLLRAHNLDTALYTKTLHEHCLSNAAEETETSKLLEQLLPIKESEDKQPTIDIAFADRTLRAFIKLCQASVVFTAFDTLFMLWLDEIASYHSDTPMVVRSLPRLFNADVDPGRRPTLMGDPSYEQERALSDLIDPWRSFTSTASEGVDGLTRTLQWLRVLAQSGVDVPIATLKQLAAFARDFGAPLDVHIQLMDALFALVWIRSLGRQDLIGLIEDIQTRNENIVAGLLKANATTKDIETFLRLSLAALLILCGIDREKVAAQGFVTEQERSGLSARRRAAGRAFPASEQLSIDMEFIATMSLYARVGTESLCRYVIKFLGLMLTESSLLETSEIDMFIAVNSDTLCRCIWHSLDWTASDLYDIRMNCMVRMLFVDPAPFETLLEELFDTHQPWHLRLEHARSLFGLILEMNNFEMHPSERDSGHRLSGVYSQFFSLIWEDDQELVRSAVETMADTLLPSHLAFIQACWDEHLERTRDVERETFVSFLLRLHPHFPTWSLVSARAIVDALFEDDDLLDGESVAHGGPHRPVSVLQRDSLSSLANTISTPGMLVTLVLQMTGHGLQIEPFDLAKIKLFLARQVGFGNAALRIAQDGTCHVGLGSAGLPKSPEQGLSCLAAAKQVLDSSSRIDASPSMLGVITATDNAVTSLVGAILVDLVLAMFNGPVDPMQMSYLLLRNWLECLVIIILKHDIKSSVLHHLEADLRSAVLKATEIFLLDIPYDNRQLALTINQCYLRKWSSDGNTILSRQINSVSQLLSSLDFNPEDILVAQGKAFLTSAFIRFPDNGLFVLLLKNAQLSDDVLRAFSHTLKDCSKGDGEDGRQFALRDVMDKVFNYTTRAEFRATISNMNRFVEAVYNDGWPNDLMNDMEMFLSKLARYTADWLPSEYEGDAALLMCATIAEHNRGSSRLQEMLLHTDTLLRATLMRFDVKTSSLDRLLKVAHPITSSSSSAPTKTDNHLAIAIIDCLRDALMGKGRVTLKGIGAMLETAYALARSPNTRIPFSIPGRLAADCLAYLQAHPSPANNPVGIGNGAAERYPDLAFSVCLDAAKVFILGLEGQSAALRAACGIGAGPAMFTRAPQTLRIWAFLALAALLPSQPTTTVADVIPSLLNHTADFAFAFSSLMQTVISARDPNSVDNAGATELTYVYISLVVWLLLARLGPRGREDERAAWGALWTAFERVIVRANGLEGGEPLPIAPSISNMYTDVILFLLQSGSSLAVAEAASHASILTALRDASRVESVRQKYNRTLRSLSEPPARLTDARVVEQAWGNLLAAEKLNYAFEMARQAPRRAL